MTTLVGYVIDASECADSSVERVEERLCARLNAVLQDAQKKLLQGNLGGKTWLVSSLLGLKTGSPWIDLCQAIELTHIPPSTAEGLLWQHNYSGNTHKHRPSYFVGLLLDHIQSCFTDTGYRLLVGHLSRHPRLSTQIDRSIYRTARVIEVLRDGSQFIITWLIIYYGAAISRWITGPSFPYPGLAYTALMASILVPHVYLGRYIQDIYIPHLQPVQLAKSAYNDWTMDAADIQPRPASEAISNLQQLISAKSAGHDRRTANPNAILSELALRCIADDVGGHQGLVGDQTGFLKMIDHFAVQSRGFQKKKLVLFSEIRFRYVVKQFPIGKRLKEAGIEVELYDNHDKTTKESSYKSDQ